MVARGVSFHEFHTPTIRSGSPYGSGRSTTAFSTENSALFRPMPSASVSTAVSVNPGDRDKDRAACRTSCHTASTMTATPF